MTQAQQLASAGVYLMPAAELNRCIGADDGEWARFALHWDELVPDPYAAELGTTRRRRYGHFRFADGVATPLPHDTFVQPEDSNPLYLERDRHFEPLTETFAKEPLLHRILALLGRFAASLDARVEQWSA